MPLAGRRYFASTAVFISEVLKLTLCYTLALYKASKSSPGLPATSILLNVTSALFAGDSWKLAIPASLFVLTSSLQYFAVSHLDSATFQVTSQFKILPTALMSVFLLKRRLSTQKWAALALLMAGVIIVQLPSDNSSSPGRSRGGTSTFFHRSLRDGLDREDFTTRAMSKRSATYEGIDGDDVPIRPPMHTGLGVTAAILGATVSAAASVYFEKVLKGAAAPISLWIRNAQLAFYSLFPSLFIGVMFFDGEEIAKCGFFVGYNWVVWATIALQANLGILVSVCVTYADNIAKNFAISISILISLCASVWLFEFAVTTNVRPSTIKIWMKSNFPNHSFSSARLS